MSQENVEVVQAVYALFGDPDAFRRGEQDEVFLDYFSPDYELIPPPIYPDIASSYRGLDGTHRWQRVMDQVWVDWRVQAERFFDAGDQVAVFVRTSGTARQSGAPVGISVAHVFTLEDGRVTRLEAFLDRHEALEAVGLSG